jgi:hypothetical protein
MDQVSIHYSPVQRSPDKTGFRLYEPTGPKSNGSTVKYTEAMFLFVCLYKKDELALNLRKLRIQLYRSPSAACNASIRGIGRPIARGVHVPGVTCAVIPRARALRMPRVARTTPPRVPVWLVSSGRRCRFTLALIIQLVILFS